LSRLCQSDEAATRSLGLPVSGPPIGVFSLFRLPLGAFRPHDLMYVYEQDGRIAGLVRVEREATRDEWTIVELDAVGVANAGEIRYRLVQQLLREGAKRGAVRFHVACADADDNIELFMQAGFMRYGDERILFRPTSLALPEPWSDEQAADCRIRPTAGIDAVALSRLYASATPQPVQRLEAVREDVAADREVERPEADRREQHQLERRRPAHRLDASRLSWRPMAEPTIDDVDALVGPATPQFAFQLRARVRELVADLPEDDPVRVYAEGKAELLERLGLASTKAENSEPESRARIGWETIPSSAPASDPLPPAAQ